MKYARIILGLTSLLVVACTDKYEQEYKTYRDFEKVTNANPRSKSWFPDIISTDAYNIKNVSYLDPLCAFGTFTYSDKHFYDSIFERTETDKIDLSKFKEKVNENLKRRPVWFIETDAIAEGEYQTIQLERFYIVRNFKAKKVYFILSN